MRIVNLYKKNGEACFKTDKPYVLFIVPAFIEPDFYLPDYLESNDFYTYVIAFSDRCFIRDNCEELVNGLFSTLNDIRAVIYPKKNSVGFCFDAAWYNPYSVIGGKCETIIDKFLNFFEEKGTALIELEMRETGMYENRIKEKGDIEALAKIILKFLSD